MTLTIFDENGIAHQKFINIQKILMGTYYIYGMQILLELNITTKMGDEFTIRLGDYDRFQLFEEDEQ